jgi:hypothetical protein
MSRIVIFILNVSTFYIILVRVFPLLIRKLFNELIVKISKYAARGSASPPQSARTSELYISLPPSVR